MKKCIILFYLIFFNSCQKKYPNFDKIYYKTTTCFGTCPAYFLEINQDRTFKLFAKTVFKDGTSVSDLEYDSAKIGYFGGNIDDKTFEKLNEQIRIITSNGYKYDRNHMIYDSPQITLTVQRGGDKTCFETFNPTENFQKNVLNLLNEICENTKMRKIEKFETYFKNGCW